MPIRLVLVLTVLLPVLAAPLVSQAQPMGMGPGMHGGGAMGPGMQGRGPYGSCCPGPRWGRPYGAPRPISTADDAKQVIQTFFSSRGQPVTVGKMEERNWYFQADVLDKKGGVADRVIVDKRTGRLRSIY